MPEAIRYRTEFERDLFGMTGPATGAQLRLEIRLKSIEAAARCFEGRGYLANDLINTARQVENYLIEEVAIPAPVDTTKEAD